MLKKTITYSGFDDEEITEDFYFNITKAELVEMEVSHPEGLQAYIMRIVQTDNRAALINAFKAIVAKAYGRRSEDGKHFVKTNQMSEEFASTEAYSVLFMELVEDAEKAAEFFTQIMPKDLQAQVKANTEEEKKDENKVVPAHPMKMTKDPTKMTRAELVQALSETRGD